MGQNEIKGRHTPGPWKVNGYGYRKNDAAPTGREVYICGADSGLAEGFTINAANVQVCRIDRHTRAGDAALIAAAPELLEACIGAAQVLKHFPAESLEGGRYRACMDAIARAENGGAA